MKFFLVAFGAFALTVSLALADPVPYEAEKTELLNKLFESNKATLDIVEIRGLVERLNDIFAQQEKERIHVGGDQHERRLITDLHGLTHYSVVRCTKKYFSGLELLIANFTYKFSPNVKAYVQDVLDTQFEFCRKYFDGDFSYVISEEDNALSILEEEMERSD